MMNVTLKECANRGYNLLVTAVLFFGGVAFGSVAFSPVENDWATGWMILDCQQLA